MGKGKLIDEIPARRASTTWAPFITDYPGRCRLTKAHRKPGYPSASSSINGRRCQHLLELNDHRPARADEDQQAGERGDGEAMFIDQTSRP